MYSVNMPEPEAELSYDTVNQGKSTAGISRLKGVFVYYSDHDLVDQIPSVIMLRNIIFLMGLKSFW